MYVNAQDTLTIQMQGQNPFGVAGSAYNFINSFGATSNADANAQSIVAYMNSKGFAAAIDSDGTNLDGSLYIVMDVTAEQDYSDSSDVLSIAQSAWYNSTNQFPSAAVVTDINGISTGVAAPTPGPGVTPSGAIANPGAAASAAATAVQPVTNAVGNLLTGLQQFGTTALVFIVVIVLALLYFLTTEGGGKVARLALA